MHKQIIELFILISKLDAVLNRRLAGRMSGLGFTEFVILSHLEDDKEGRMRRIDLADKVGLTPSGITRVLLPMEKIGLIKKVTNKEDARESLVVILSGGKRKLEEAMLEMGEFIEDAIPVDLRKQLNTTDDMIKKLIMCMR